MIEGVLLFILLFFQVTFADDLSYIAFDYYHPTDEDLLFLSNFQYVVTGNFLEEEKVDFLKRCGVKLLYYEWLPAEYVCMGKANDSWKKKILENVNRWVIDDSPTDPDPMGRKYGCRDYFFSFTNDFIDERIKNIMRNLKENKYDGVFFDWATGSKIFEQREYSFLRKRFKEKFPGLDYDKQIEKFLRMLKEKGIIIALNRGFRSKKAAFDKWADMDVAESVFTTDSEDFRRKVFLKEKRISTVYETTFTDPELAISTAKNFLEKARSTNPSINFVFLNYAFPYYENSSCERDSVYIPVTDEQAILYAISLSLLVDSFSFTAGRNVSLRFVKSNSYFLDLGKPLGRYKFRKVGKKKVWIREFSNGIVVVGYHGTTVDVNAHGHKKAYDVLEKKEIPVKDGKFVIPLYSRSYFDNRFQPVGKIVLWKVE
ncbi:MAG: hypothetical protein DSY34_05315 [Desulfurobacterium sp.]|nr:MAG: hypothetical protein DSY34_05315 [Desulfurobacterium sp.]